MGADRQPFLRFFSYWSYWTRWTRWLLLVVGVAGGAGAAATEHQPGAWGVFSVSGALGDTTERSRWRYWFDGQHRRFDVGSGIHQTLLRPAVSYDLGNGLSAWLGYAYVDSRRASGERVTEHRPWQQLGWSGLSTERGTLSMRLRLEQRDVDVSDELGWTLRFQLRYAHRLDSANRWQAIAFVEPFVALRETDWGGAAGLRQNRVFLGASRTLTAETAIELGYLNQHLRRGGEDLANHLAVVHFKLRL